MDDVTERKFDSMAKWIGTLEERVDRDSSKVVFGIDKRVAILESIVERLGKDVHQISQNIGRLVWAVGLTLLAGVVQFMLKGGFGGA